MAMLLISFLMAQQSLFASPPEFESISIERTADSADEVRLNFLKNSYIKKIVSVPYPTTVYEWVTEEYYVYERQCKTEQKPVRVCKKVNGVEQCTIVNRPVQTCKMVPVKKTRRVQKSRRVMRCCRDEERLVFDHQWPFDALARFEPSSKPAPNELEKFEFALVGDEGAASVELKPNDSHAFRYELEIHSKSASSAIIDVRAKPKYSPEDLGESTISDVKLSFDSSTPVIQLIDTGVRPRVSSNYELQLYAGSRVVTAVAMVGNGNGRLEWRLPNETRFEKAMSLQVNVMRSGAPLLQPISFSTKRHFRVLTESELADPSNLHILGLISSSSGRGLPLLAWNDKLAGSTIALNEYRVEVFSGLLNKRICAADFSERQVSRLANGNFGVSVGMLKCERTFWNNSGKSVTVRVTASRADPFLKQTILAHQKRQIEVP